MKQERQPIKWNTTNGTEHCRDIEEAAGSDLVGEGISDENSYRKGIESSAKQ